MLVVEGGDLACGELLMVVHRRVRDLAAGTVIGVTTTDPAAAIDLPAWCHLTGHTYRGSQLTRTGVAYIVEIAGQRSPVDPERPWHRPTATQESP